MKNKKDTISFEQFGSDFQNKLATIISRDSSFSNQIQEVLEYNYFESKHLQVYVRKIFDYVLKYKTHPSIETIKTILKSELEQENEMLQEQIKEFFSNFVLSSQKMEDVEYVKDKSLDFCKKQRLKEAMLKSIDLLQKSSFDEISATINNALKLGINADIGHDYLRDFELRYEERQRKPISTGWPEIDIIMGGGVGRSELFVVIAPTSCGKSFVLVHLGCEALKQGKTVIHYTLELSDVHTASRYDSCLSGYSLNDLKVFKSLVYEKIKDIPGHLIVKEYPTKSVSIKTIRNHLDKLEQKGIIPDIVIVDYGDLLKNISSQKEKRFDLEEIFESLRALAQEKRCVVITASQTRRESLEKEVITMESIAESFSKCFIADFIMSLSRTIEDKNSNQGRFFIAKNRNGPDSIVFPIFMDPSISKIRILPRQNGDEKLINGDQNGEVNASHREKYKELLKNKKSKKKE